jgi:predicted CXXCH cytochrome family protein
MRNCTECHVLRQRGASNSLCLSCHVPLKSRIAANRGYHAAVRAKACGSCHKEHLGTAARVTRFDTAAFQHAETGFELKGGHVEAGCRECHVPERITAADIRTVKGSPGYLHRTFLGVGTGCSNCHRTESPHGRQFGARGCADCHDERNWNSAPRFDHSKTKYALTGTHKRVECKGCHTGASPESMRWAPLRFGACTDCHRDPHAGKMTGGCTSCHSPDGWRRFDSQAVERKFDHSRTRFPLRGSHAKVKCSGCHSAQQDRRVIAIEFAANTAGFTYVRPVVENCASCHVDPHPERLRMVAGPRSCASCHTEQNWTPTTYDMARHNKLPDFPLRGAHAVVNCQSCHGGPAPGNAFVLPRTACRSCHVKDDPHKGVYGLRDCGQCHRTTDFKDTFFDHAGARGAACTNCHRGDDPHAGQFRNVGCDRCHVTTTFRIERFDHRATRYPLDGKHVRVSCASCHRPESAPSGRTFTRYKPLATTCSACHGGTR